MLICSPSGWIFRHAAFHAGHHQVLDADVGKRAARHDAVVAATRAVAVEILERRRRSRSRYFPAGEVFLIAPAGEMWSVVTLSPKMPSARAPLISVMLPGCHREVRRRTAAPGCRWILRVPFVNVAGARREFRSTSDSARRNRCRACGKLPACSAALHLVADFLQASARCPSG